MYVCTCQTWCSVGPCGEDHCTDGQIREMADTLVSTGMRDLGYDWIVLDDCWHPSRAANGSLVPFPRFFPHGMAPVIDYAHARGANRPRALAGERPLWDRVAPVDIRRVGNYVIQQVAFGVGTPLAPTGNRTASLSACTVPRCTAKAFTSACTQAWVTRHATVAGRPDR